MSGMGDIRQLHHVHHLDPEQLDIMLDALRQRFAGIVAAEAPRPATNPLDLGLELWSFHSPSAGCNVVAYIDDHNQVRHVPDSRTTDVPKHWKRIWLEDRRDT